MTSKTFGLIFYLKKPKKYSKGPVPIYMRLTIDGKRTEFSTKRNCDDSGKWISSAGRMSGTKDCVRTLNAHLDALQNKVHEVYKSLLQTDESIGRAYVCSFNLQAV